MSTQIIAWIRTVTPSLVGLLAGWLLTLGIELSPETRTQLALGLAGLFTAVYHFAVTKAEKKFPWIGVLLGVAKSPDGYSKGEVSDSFEGQASVTVETTVVAPASSTPIYDDLAAIPYLHN